MKLKSALLPVVAFGSIILMAPPVAWAHQIASFSEGSMSVTCAMKGPVSKETKKAVRSKPLPEKDTWDKQWFREEFEQGVVKFVLKDMIGEKGYKYFILSNPPRIVIDLQDPKHLPPSHSYQLPLQGRAFHKMRVGLHPDKVRFVLDLVPGGLPKPSVHAEGPDLIVMAGPFSDTSRPAELPALSEKLPSADTVVPQPLEEDEGGRTLTEIREVVASYMGGLRYLYNKELRTNPSLYGKVTVMFEIAPSGQVIQTAVLSSSLQQSKSLEEAILVNIQSWKFSQAPQESGNIKVTYPFIFSPPSLELSETKKLHFF